MRKLKHIKLFEAYFFESEGTVIPSTDPLALAILGAPAGGKTYNKQLLAKLDSLTQLAKAANPNFSEDLTVNILRGEIQKLPDDKQIELFYWGYYTLRDLAKEDNEYDKWFTDIENLWSGKLKHIMVEHGITVEIDDKNDLTLNDKIGDAAISVLSSADLNDIIEKLDQYQDYKRAVRSYQIAVQQVATEKRKDIVYDESGDEPNKIIKNMKKLDKADYVTDVIMIHHKDVINNLFQNAVRMINGNDGGRDSSGSIVKAYLDIKDGMGKYKDAAEVSVSVSTHDIQKGKGPAIDALSKANTADDDKKGNKPIDVFVRIYGDEPEDVLTQIKKELTVEQFDVFKALIVYQVNEPEIGVPSKTKDLVLTYIDMSKSEALDTLEKANSGDLVAEYKYDQGGINDKLIERAKEALA